VNRSAQWHLFFWFLAATGVRISEAIALQWRHLALDAPVPHVKVRRVFRRVLQPAREAADLPWVGFHAFRHTCASILFAEGRNAVQVQRWLGHHSASFTLATYVDEEERDRRADEEALRSVRKTPEQLKRENEVFALPADRIRLNLDSAHSLS